MPILSMHSRPQKELEKSTRTKVICVKIKKTKVCYYEPDANKSERMKNFLQILSSSSPSFPFLSLSFSLSFNPPVSSFSYIPVFSSLFLASLSSSPSPYALPPPSVFSR